MAISRILLLNLLLILLWDTSFGIDHKVKDSPRLKFRLRRIIRDVTGHYHPEGHTHSFHSVYVENPGNGEFHAISASSNDKTGASVSSLAASNAAATVTTEECDCGHGGGTPGFPAYAYPPANNEPVEPLCGCYVKGRCADTLRSFTDLVIRNQLSQLKCGADYELCCFENDPWPGVTDIFAHLAPCVPDNLCRRPYGILPTDVRDYGSIGPCPGQGAVRCLDEKAPIYTGVVTEDTGPNHYVVPVIPPTIPNPVPPAVVIPPVAPTPSVVYSPPQEPVIIYLPPQPAPEPPQTIYEPPTSAIYTPPPPAPVPVLPPTAPVLPPPLAPVATVGGYGIGGFPYLHFNFNKFGGFYPGGFGFRKHLSFSKGIGVFG